MSDQTNGGSDTPTPQRDPEVEAFEELHKDRRPMWEEWSAEKQDAASAALAAAREDPGPTPEQQARDWSTAVTNTRMAEKIESGIPLAKAEREAMAVREMTHDPDLAAAGVLATGETVTAEELDGMPWYEVRVEAYVRNGPPGEYGVGGDKIAHVRASTQAPSFAAASQRLDADLGPKWQQLLQMAPLADQAPTPEIVLPAVTWDYREGRAPWPRPLVAWAAAAFLLALVILLVLR